MFLYHMISPISLISYDSLHIRTTLSASLTEKAGRSNIIRIIAECKGSSALRLISFYK